MEAVEFIRDENGCHEWEREFRNIWMKQLNAKLYSSGIICESDFDEIGGVIEKQSGL